MTDLQENINTTEAPATEATQSSPAPVAHGNRRPLFRKNPRQDRGDKRGSKREPKAKPEFDQKIVDIRRVTRVTSGGRKFSFAVAVIAGDRKGRVGFGTGKGLDTAVAVDKAYRKAKKNLIQIPLTKNGLIPHDVFAKYASARVEIRPAPGKGVAAGSAVRDVLELAGVKDVIGKIRSGSKNKMNNARAAISALSMLNTKKKVKHL